MPAINSKTLGGFSSEEKGGANLPIGRRLSEGRARACSEGAPYVAAD
jgi:hypothetical protein